MENSPKKSSGRRTAETPQTGTTPNTTHQVGPGGDGIATSASRLVNQGAGSSRLIRLSPQWERSSELTSTISVVPRRSMSAPARRTTGSNFAGEEEPNPEGYRTAGHGSDVIRTPSRRRRTSSQRRRDNHVSDNVDEDDELDESVVTSPVRKRQRRDESSEVAVARVPEREDIPQTPTEEENRLVKGYLRTSLQGMLKNWGDDVPRNAFQLRALAPQPRRRASSTGSEASSPRSESVGATPVRRTKGRGRRSASVNATKSPSSGVFIEARPPPNTEEIMVEMLAKAVEASPGGEPVKKRPPPRNLRLLETTGHQHSSIYGDFQHSPLLGFEFSGRRGTKLTKTPVKKLQPFSAGSMGEAVDELLALDCYFRTVEALRGDTPSPCDAIVGRKDEVEFLTEVIRESLTRKNKPCSSFVHVKASRGFGASSIMREIFFNDTVELPEFRFGIIADVDEYALRSLADQLIPDGPCDGDTTFWRTPVDRIFCQLREEFATKFVDAEKYKGASCIPGIVVVKLVKPQTEELGLKILERLFQLVREKYELMFIVMDVGDPWDVAPLACHLRFDLYEEANVPGASLEIHPYTAKQMHKILLKRISDEIEQGIEILPSSMIRRIAGFVAKFDGNIRTAMTICKECVHLSQKRYEEDKEASPGLKHVVEDDFLQVLLRESASAFAGFWEEEYLKNTATFKESLAVFKTGVLMTLEKLIANYQVNLFKARNAVKKFSATSHFAMKERNETKKRNMRKELSDRVASLMLLLLQYDGHIGLTFYSNRNNLVHCKDPETIMVTIDSDVRRLLPVTTPTDDLGKDSAAVGSPVPRVREYAGRRLRSLTRRSYAEADDGAKHP